MSASVLSDVFYCFLTASQNPRDYKGYNRTANAGVPWELTQWRYGEEQGFLRKRCRAAPKVWSDD